MNCLIFCLHFWNTNREYKIMYNSDHCINVPIGTNIIKGSNGYPDFTDITNFGYNNIRNSFIDLFTEQKDLELLEEYFSVM